MKNLKYYYSKSKFHGLCILALFIMLFAVLPAVSVKAAGGTHNITIDLKKKSSKKTILLTKGYKIKISGDTGKKILSGKNLKYSSSNKNIAKVTNKGVITGRKIGKCKITITSKDKKNKCVITMKVMNKVAAKSVELDMANVTLKKGESKRITAKVFPETTTNQKVSFNSSDAAVVTVSDSGVITAMGAGQTIVTATADGKSAKCTVTVNEDAKDDSGNDDNKGKDDNQGNNDNQGNADIKVASITLNYTSNQILVGGAFTLTPTVAPANATNKNVTFKSSNTAIATVTAAGVVSGVAAGNATITCTAADGSGVSRTCSVTVVNAVMAGASGDVSYALYRTSNTTYRLEITGNGAMADYSWSYGDYNTPWHEYKAYITELVVGNGVTYIGAHAFDNHTALASLVLPTSVTGIGEGAFAVTYDRNPELTMVTLNEGLISIGEGAFRNQKSISGTLTIPSTVTTIAASAFSMNDTGAISSLVFANGSRLTSIGDYAFYNNDHLTCAIAFPDSLESIGNSAFRNCCIYNSGTGITSVSFGVNSQLETIGAYAFDSIYKLSTITLPVSVSSIGAGAFAQDAQAHDLTQINYRGTADQYWTLCNTNAISATDNDNIRVSASGDTRNSANTANITYSYQ